MWVYLLEVVASTFIQIILCWELSSKSLHIVTHAFIDRVLFGIGEWHIVPLWMSENWKALQELGAGIIYDWGGGGIINVALLLYQYHLLAVVCTTNHSFTSAGLETFLTTASLGVGALFVLCIHPQMSLIGVWSHFMPSCMGYMSFDNCI